MIFRIKKNDFFSHFFLKFGLLKNFPWKVGKKIWERHNRRFRNRSYHNDRTVTVKIKPFFEIRPFETWFFDLKIRKSFQKSFQILVRKSCFKWWNFKKRLNFYDCCTIVTVRSISKTNLWRFQNFLPTFQGQKLVKKIKITNI